MDSKVIKNYLLLAAVKRMGLPYRQKQNLYLLITISGDPILYRNGIICLKTKSVQLQVKG